MTLVSYGQFSSRRPREPGLIHALLLTAKTELPDETFRRICPTKQLTGNGETQRSQQGKTHINIPKIAVWVRDQKVGSVLLMSALFRISGVVCECKSYE